jgi:hypothetical protein
LYYWRNRSIKKLKKRIFGTYVIHEFSWLECEKACQYYMIFSWNLQIISINFQKNISAYAKSLYFFASILFLYQLSIKS